MREPPGKSIMLIIAKRFFHDGRDIVVVKEAPTPFLAQLVFQFDDLPCGPQGGPFQIPPNSSAVSLDMPDIFLDQHLQFGFFLGFGVHAGHVFHQPPDGDALFLGHEQSNAPGDRRPALVFNSLIQPILWVWSKASSSTCRSGRMAVFPGKLVVRIVRARRSGVTAMTGCSGVGKAGRSASGNTRCRTRSAKAYRAGRDSRKTSAIQVTMPHRR